MKQRRVASQGTQELDSYRKNSGISQTTRTSAGKKNDNPEDKILSIINSFKNYKISHLTRPSELGTMTSKVAKRNSDTTRLWNDYVFQIATR